MIFFLDFCFLSILLIILLFYFCYNKTRIRMCIFFTIFSFHISSMFRMNDIPRSPNTKNQIFFPFLFFFDQQSGVYRYALYTLSYIITQYEKKSSWKFKTNNDMLDFYSKEIVYGTTIQLVKQRKITFVLFWK